MAAFIQESIHQVSASSNHALELPEAHHAEVTKIAFEMLGEGGLIQSADQHSCGECTHTYKQYTDRITEDDPAALLGVDEHNVVPALEGGDADLAVQDAAQARFNARNAMNVDGGDNNNNKGAPVKLVVIDGQVMELIIVHIIIAQPTL